MHWLFGSQGRTLQSPPNGRRKRAGRAGNFGGRLAKWIQQSLSSRRRRQRGAGRNRRGWAKMMTTAEAGAGEQRKRLRREADGEPVTSRLAGLKPTT